MSQFDKIIFGKLSFSNLLEDIYNNSRSKAVDLEAMVRELRVLIKTPQDAILIVPLIADYFGKGIQNDDALIRMASIVQRILAREQNTSKDTTFDLMISPDDLTALQQSYDDMNNIKVPEIPEKIKLNASKDME